MHKAFRGQYTSDSYKNISIECQTCLYLLFIVSLYVTFSHININYVRLCIKVHVSPEPLGELLRVEATWKTNHVLPSIK